MDMFWGHMVILQCKFEYGTKFNGHSPTPAYCHFLNLFRQFLTILNSSNYQWTTEAGVIKSEIQFLRPKEWPFCPKCHRAGFWPENPFFCYCTPDFVNGPFVTLDDIFDLAPSDRFLVAVRPLGGPFSGHRAGFWPENPFFAIGPRISSMARL